MRCTFEKSPSTNFCFDPKKGEAKDLKEFRLVSLVGNLYKILA